MSSWNGENLKNRLPAIYAILMQQMSDRGLFITSEESDGKYVPGGNQKRY
jgi:hypothetical protein